MFFNWAWRFQYSTSARHCAKIAVFKKEICTKLICFRLNRMILCAYDMFSRANLFKTKFNCFSTFLVPRAPPSLSRAICWKASISFNEICSISFFKWEKISRSAQLSWYRKYKNCVRLFFTTFFLRRFFYDVFFKTSKNWSFCTIQSGCSLL